MLNAQKLRAVKSGVSRMPAPIRGRVAQMLFRGYESYVATRQSVKEGPVVSNGLPVPPPKLRVKVIGVPDVDIFLSTGRQHNDLIRDVLRGAGIEVITAADSTDGRRYSFALKQILDWGCGCGRVLRWWDDLPNMVIHGCDYNSDLVDWVDQNLPFASARVNQLAPPLPYEADSFDFVYAISVFTHLTEDLARDWMREIHRVLAPGGLFFFSTHGKLLRYKLDPSEMVRFDSGAPVVQFSSNEGSNLCSAYHPREWIESSLLDGFELVEVREAHLLDDPETAVLDHDRWLIRKL